MKTMSCETYTNDHSNISVNLTQQLLLILNTWEKIVEFIEQEQALPLLKNPNSRRQCERTLRDMDTYIVAAALVLRQLQGGKPYSLNELASVLQPHNESLRNSAKQKIRETMLPRVGDYYGLFDYSKPDDPWNGQHGYQIQASEVLLAFFNDIVFPRLRPSHSAENSQRHNTPFYYPHQQNGFNHSYLQNIAV